MTVRKQVIDGIKSMLTKEIQTVEGLIRGNIYTMKKLVEEQTVLKRKKAELYKLLNTLYKED
jgi:hypothetical protein